VEETNTVITFFRENTNKSLEDMENFTTFAADFTIEQDEITKNPLSEA